MTHEKNHKLSGHQSDYHVLLGSPEKKTPQYGVLGITDDSEKRKIAIDLNTILCTCLFGEPGAGKSYAMGSYVETALTHMPGVNKLAKPLAAIVFHYSPSPVYKPELAASFLKNNKPDQLASLKNQYGADPAAINEMLILAPKGMVQDRREEFGAITPESNDPHAPWSGIRAEPIAFASDKLTATQWKILMGAIGETDSLYLQVINQILRECRDQKHPITTTTIREGIKARAHLLSKADLDLSEIRLRLAEEYVHDEAPHVASWIKRGRMVIIDLRDEFIQKKEALSLAIVMLQLFSDATDSDGGHLQKLFVLDEAHKYMQDKTLVEYLTEIIREMRHKATSVMIASQDPPSIPDTIIELASMVVALRMSAPGWVSHIKKVKLAFEEIAPYSIAALKTGQAYIWVKECSDPAYTKTPVKVNIRPRATRHGGDTKVAVQI